MNTEGRYAVMANKRSGGGGKTMTTANMSPDKEWGNLMHAGEEQRQAEMRRRY
jgi:hypothetical protein